LTKKLRKSLTTRTFFITALMLVMICVFTYGFIAWVMPMTYGANLKRELSTKAEQLVTQLQQRTLANCQPLIDQFARASNANVYIADMNNEMIRSSAGSIAVSTNEVIATVGDDSNSFKQKNKDNQITSDNFKIATTQCYQFHFSSDKNTYNLIITMGMQTVNQATKALQQIFPWLVLIVLAVSLLGSWYYSRYITRPIVKLSSIAKRMSEMEFDWRCDDTRSDEIGLLGQSLNELAEKLSTTMSELRAANLLLQNDIDKERELDRQRLEFFSAVSHELKTPITVIKGQLEGMLGNIGVYRDHETYLAKCMSVVGLMEGMVQEILTITRMDSSGFEPQMRSLDLTALVEKQLDDYRDFLEQKYLSLHTDLTPGLMISGDYKLLQKAVSNLISNAVRYSPIEESVYIKTYRKKDMTILSIENTGTYIPENAIPHLFEAFYRVEQSRNRQTGGSGLGLYLVSRIANVHGAECRIENIENGVRATLYFS